MDQSLMDELFERIKILEEEKKSLENELTELDLELKTKRTSHLCKLWQTEKEQEEDKKKKDQFNQELSKYKKLFEDNFNFPPTNIESSSSETIVEPITFKNPNFDENEILNFFKLLYQQKTSLSTEKQKAIEKIEKNISLKTKMDSSYDSLAKEFEKRFIGRVINYNNSNYEIKLFNSKDKHIKAMLLYDPNGIKIDALAQEKRYFYTTIEVAELFETSYILSKEESEQVMSNFKKDNRNFIKIYYQLQVDKNSHSGRGEKELIPYRIEPNYVDLGQYQLNIQDNLIKSVQNKENGYFVSYDSIVIGDGKSTTGLVSSSLIKVYTTLYSKDILNILHIHINDTSQEITIDSEFLEKDDKELNHKIFDIDAMGKRLTYKLLFRDYKLSKIYYNVSTDFIDEPPFEEIRIVPNNYVKILKGDYKDYYGQVTDFPIGMLARKDKELGELRKMSSKGYQKEGFCGDRHFAELPGFVSVEIMFMPGTPLQQLPEHINISIPVCHLIPLSPTEQIKFEKNIIVRKEMEIEESIDAVEKYYKQCQEYETYLKNDSLLEAKTLDEVKNILDQVEKINMEQYQKNISEDLVEKVNYIQDIKGKIQSLLIQKIRLFKLTGHK